MRLKRWHALALIFCTVWLVYYPALSVPFNPIDDTRMVGYLLNRDAFAWRDFLIPSSSTYFRPLIWSSFISDRLMWNLEPSFLHLENLLLHWFNTMLVFAVARRVAVEMKLDSLMLPLVAALLFAVHPINSETVIWVAGRADLLVTTFILLSLYCALRYTAEGTWRWLTGLMLAFFLGSLAKETALFVWPGLVLMGWLLFRLERRRRPASGRHHFFPALVCLPVIAGYFLARGYALRGRDLGMQHLGKALQLNEAAPTASEEIVKAGDLTGLLQNVLTTAGFYARKLLQPLPLNFGIVDVPDGYLWIGLLLLIIVAVLLWRLTWPGVMMLTAMSLASIALLVSLGGVSWTPIAERYMYAPTALLSVSLTLGGAQWLARYQPFFRTLVSCAVALLLVIGATATFQRTLVWSDNLLLFRDTIAKSPDFGLAQYQLAMLLYDRGDKSEALEILRELKVTETQPASLSMALVFMEEGRLEEAKQFLLERQNNPASVTYRGEILKTLLKVAQRQLDRCTEMDCRIVYQNEVLVLYQNLLEHTGDPFYHYIIGQFFLAFGEREAARESFSAAYEKLPDSSLHKKPAGKLAASLKEP